MVNRREKEIAESLIQFRHFREGSFRLQGELGAESLEPRILFSGSPIEVGEVETTDLHFVKSGVLHSGFESLDDWLTQDELAFPPTETEIASEQTVLLSSFDHLTPAEVTYLRGLENKTSLTGEERDSRGFAGAPRVDSEGRLVFTPEAGVNGEALIEVGTGGEARIYRIEIQIEEGGQVSEITPAARSTEVTCGRGVGFVQVESFALIDVGCAELDRLGFVANCSRPEIFSRCPSVGLDGVLRFVSLQNASGMVEVDLNLTDGKESFGRQSFSIEFADAALETPQLNSPLLFDLAGW